MRLQDFKPIMAKTLRESLAMVNVDSIVERLIERMSVYQEMLEVAGSESIIVPDSPKVYAVIPSVPEGPTVDVTQRITHSQNLSEEQIVELKNKWFSTYQAQLQQRFEVGSPDFDPPVIMQFVGIDRGPAAIPLIKVRYVVVNGGMTHELAQNVLEVMLSAKEVEGKIREQVIATYHKDKHQIMPTLPPPVSSSFDDRMKGAVHDEADRYTAPASSVKDWPTSANYQSSWKRNIEPADRD